MPIALETAAGLGISPYALMMGIAMAASSILAITIIPVLMLWFVRGNIRSEERHPVSRLLRAVYSPVLKATLPPLLLELPPYRLPSIKRVLVSVWQQTRLFLKTAGTVVLLAAAAIAAR